MGLTTRHETLCSPSAEMHTPEPLQVVKNKQTKKQPFHCAANKDFNLQPDEDTAFMGWLWVEYLPTVTHQTNPCHTNLTTKTLPLSWTYSPLITFPLWLLRQTLSSLIGHKPSKVKDICPPPPHPQPLPTQQTCTKNLLPVNQTASKARWHLKLWRCCEIPF